MKKRRVVLGAAIDRSDPQHAHRVYQRARGLHGWLGFNTALEALLETRADHPPDTWPAIYQITNDQEVNDGMGR
jgi:hypothetical protein